MASRTRSIAVALCAVASLGVAACGGGGDSDEDKIRDVISDVDENPASLCTDHGTDELVQQLGGEEACSTAAEEAAKENPSETEVKSVEIDGDTAVVEATDDSGDSKITFVKQDGDWLVSKSE